MKRIIFIFLLIMFPLMTKAITGDEFREAVANVSISAATTYSDEFAYSFYWGGTPENPVKKTSETNRWLTNAYKGIKSSGYKYGSTISQAGIQGSFKDKFGVNCDTFVKLMIYHASNGMLEYNKDFEKIKLSEIRKGDLIHFPNHIAIFIDDNFDNSSSTYNVVEASGTIHYKLRSRTADHGFRVKESSLAKLDYNHVFSSYDFHDRLDDFNPIINSVSQIKDKILINAVDYKHYELADRSDILEPENNGIVGYQITKENIEPTTWIKINKTESFNQEVDGVTKAGTYYIWVIDVGGNVSKKTLIANDYIEDVNNIGSLTYESKTNKINVSIKNEFDSDGIKEYRYYLDGVLIHESTSNEYQFENLISNKKYRIYYEIVDNKNNIYKSQVYEISTLKNILEFKVLEKEKTIKIGENYQINVIINALDDNYVVTYTEYDSKIINITKDGLVTGISEGSTYVKVQVDDYYDIIQIIVNKNEIEQEEEVDNASQKKKKSIYQLLLIIISVALGIMVFVLIVSFFKK